MASHGGLSPEEQPLTSCRPFSVSWKTPVFWDVSRWDFRALFPIGTLVPANVEGRVS